jgi:hypothetical protein
MTTPIAWLTSGAWERAIKIDSNKRGWQSYDDPVLMQLVCLSEVVLEEPDSECNNGCEGPGNHSQDDFGRLLESGNLYRGSQRKDHAEGMSSLRIDWFGPTLFGAWSPPQF